MRADRLLSILSELQIRGGVTAETLARRFAVSRRTIYRDVEALDAMGVPVYAEPGPGGGIRLVDGYRTRLTGLSHPEIEALLLVGLAGPAADLGLGPQASSARLKLLASLPPGSSDVALVVGERFHLDPVDWYRRTVPPPAWLSTVSRAVWEGRRLTIDYASWTRRSQRVIDPLGLVLKATIWYLVARSRKTPRIYRVDQIRDVTTLDESFDRPRDFDLPAFWDAEVKRFEDGLQRENATLRVASTAMHRVHELGVGAEDALRAEDPDAHGWRSATIPIESVDQAAPRILSFGDRIVVVAPAALRQRVATLARAVVRVYE